MDELLYAGTTKHIVKSKIYKKDRRKKVKLVSLIDKKGVQWWYIIVGTKPIMCDKVRSRVEPQYKSF